jgi:apolipoprotein D and lipocalin family protein
VPKLATAILMCLLVGCGQVPVPQPQTSLRDTATPIYSNASFDPSRLLGRWAQVSTFSAQKPTCGPGGAEFTAKDEAIFAKMRLCLPVPGTDQTGADQTGADEYISGLVTFTGPGRFEIAGSDRVFWILWADVGGRTLVLGTPSGEFGVVLNKGRQISSDRLRAAEQVLGWNGYRLDFNRLLN